MTTRTFTAGEAAAITGVSPATVADWRRRGLLEPGGGRWTRYTLRNLAHLRMTAALIEAGIPVSAAIPHGREFQDSLASAVLAAQAPEAGYTPFVAVIARMPDGSFYRSAEHDLTDLTDLQVQGPDGRQFRFTSAVIINLAALGTDMAAKLADLPVSPPAADD